MTQQSRLIINHDIRLPCQNVLVKKKERKEARRYIRAVRKKSRFVYAVRRLPRLPISSRYQRHALIPNRLTASSVVCVRARVRATIRVHPHSVCTYTDSSLRWCTGSSKTCDPIKFSVRRRKCQRFLHLGNAVNVRAVREGARHENEGGRDHADQHRANLRRYRQCVLSEKTVLSDCRSHN